MNLKLLFISTFKLRKWDNYLNFVKNEKLPDDQTLIIGQDKAEFADPKRLFTHIASYEALLRTYRLKDIAKGDSDLERVVNLFDWFCENTWYNGMQYKGIFDDGFKILRFAYKKPFSHAINCGHKAIAFSDCLLALGLKSYPVALSSNNWNHCMSQVYIGELAKWCVFDPSFHTYFTDDNGIILSVFELRALMLEGNQPIMHGYSFNNTQECQDIYMNMFVKQTLSNITTWEDNSTDRRNRYLPKNRKKFEVAVPIGYR